MGKDPSDRQQSNYFTCLAPNSIFEVSGNDDARLKIDGVFNGKLLFGADSITANANNNQMLNQTKKEIYPKQFELNMKQPKGNITIQYDSIPQPIRGSSSSKHTTNNQSKIKHQQYQQHPGQTKEGFTQKSNPHQSVERERRRGQSQSAPPKHQYLQQQANISVGNGTITQINIQVKNNKLGSGGGQQQQQAQQIQNQLLNKSGKKKMEIKFAAGMHQIATKSNSKHKKNRSDGKGQNRPQYKNNLLVMSQLYQDGQRFQDNREELLGSANMDNKENMSANLIKKNLFPLDKKHRHNTTHILNHDHSLSSQDSQSKQRKDAFTASGIHSQDPHTSNKIYFLDKSALLKQQLSPSRVDHSQNQKGKYGSNNIVMSDDEDERKGNLIGQYKTNLSTITHQIEKKQAKLKKVTLSGGNTVQNHLRYQGQVKQQNKGVDKLIKENLKKNKSKEEEEIIKRYLDDYRQRQKKVELSQRNQEVRKINASKIIYNHHHQKNSQANYQQVALKYKKQRSKSCMNKTDNIFNNIMKKEKIGELAANINNSNNNNQQYQQEQQEKRERKREKSFVLEMKELKKQIDDEIKREIQSGVIDVLVTSKKRTNLSTINVKKEPCPQSNFDMNSNNVSAIEFKTKAKKLNLSYHQTRYKKHRSKSRDPQLAKSGVKQNKIQKFIEKKKKAQMQRKSLEQTLEQEKHLKIKENLNNLSRFVKHHFRNQSHIIGNFNNNFFVKKQAPTPNQSSGQQTVKMMKKLKPKFLKHDRTDEGNLHEETKYDLKNQDRYYDVRDFDGQTPDKSAVYKLHSAVDNDVSQEGYDEYNMLVNSMQKLQGKVIKKQLQADKSLNFSSSREVSPNLNKNRQQNQPKRQLKMKIKMPIYTPRQQLVIKKQQEQDMFMNGLESSPDTSNQLTAIKKDNENRESGTGVSAFPQVPSNQISSFIPPQSDIISIEGNFDKSNLLTRHKKASLEQSEQTKSPQSFDFQNKLKILVQRYGPTHRNTSDTKLLIKLHSAAITIQIQWRKFLNRIYFDQKNESIGSEGKSSLYINSDDDSINEYHKNNKQPQYFSGPPQKLKSKAMGSLRMKQEATTYYPHHNNKNNLSPHMNDYSLNQQYLQEVENAKKDSTKMFYGDDFSDVEKVVVCSVISSERQEGDESLSNTQKYVPLRTKIQKQQQYQQQPNHKHQIQQQQQQQQQQQVSKSIDPIKNLIKNEQQKHQVQVMSDQQQLKQNKQNKQPELVGETTFSQSRAVIPPLKLTAVINKNVDQEDGSMSRSIFERKSFRDFKEKITQKKEGDQSQMQYDMFKIREEAIEYHENVEKYYIDKMYKNSQITPRTYNQRKLELEMWVTKEKDDVKKTKKKLQKQLDKTKEIIEQTEKDQERMKKQFLDSGRISSQHTKRDFDIQESGTQILSSRILDQIYDKDVEKEKNEQKLKNEKRDQELLQELQKKKQEDEKRKTQAAEDERIRQQQQQEEQKKKDDENQRIKTAEQERIRKELEQLRQKEEDARRKRDQELKDQEYQRKLQEQKEQEEKQNKILEQQKKQQKDEKARLQKEREKQKDIEKELEKERKAREDKEKLEQQMKRREEIEEKRREKEKELEKQKNLEELYKQKMVALENKFKPKQDNAQQQASDLARDKYDPRGNQQPEETKFKSEPEFQMEDQENDFLKNIVRQGKHGKIIDDDSSPEDVKASPGYAQENPSSYENEPGRALTRTRNSMDLQLDQINEGEQNIEIKSEKQDENDDQDIQIDDQEDITTKVLVDNFFTKNYDEQSEKEIMENLKNKTSDLKTILKGIGIKDTQNNQQVVQSEDDDKEEEQINCIKKKEDQVKYTQQDIRSNIYIKNEQEEENKNDNSDVSTLVQTKISPMQESNKDEEQQFNFTSSSRPNNNHSNLDYDDRNIMGAPVSPASADGGQVFGIQTGSQSLESTLSDELKFKQTVSNINSVANTTAGLGSDVDHVKFGEEIAEDIYNTLLDELKIEMDLLQMRDNQLLQKDEPPRNYIFSESGRFLIFERKGIKTDLFAIESYVEEILDEVLRDKDKFMTIINEPITKKELDILNQLQNSEIGSYEHFFDMSYPTVLPLDVYLKLEKRRKESREKEVSRDKNASPQNENANANRMDKNFLAECEHIHNKVLFDCINDSLLQFKPYGKDGTPLAWSRQVRRLKPVDQFPIEDMFEIVKHDIFRWAIMQAGTLPRKEFVFGGVFDDELFAEIREKKLATLLAREMIDTEPKWLNYEFEEAQVKIDIGDMILEFLVTETLGLLNNKVKTVGGGANSVIV